MKRIESTWECDGIDCGLVVRDSTETGLWQPTGWSTVTRTVVSKGELYHFCPDCTPGALNVRNA